jgi:hypothetical protein
MADLRRLAALAVACLAITAVPLPARAEVPPAPAAPSASPTEAASVPLYRQVREVGRALGLPEDTHSFSITAGSLNGDNRPDLLFGLHSHVLAYLNQPTGLELAFEHRGGDSHACTIADVNTDDRGDLYCVIGGAHGNGTKRNRLWLQGEDGAYTEHAVAWNLTDPLGRGRRARFLDLNADDRPDLFVGNEYPREDGRPTPNQTFVHAQGRFARPSIGATQEIGGLCVESADQNGDGLDDVLVCGGRGPATPGPGRLSDRLYLYRQSRNRNGATVLTDVAPALGVGVLGVESAAMSRLDDNRSLDLVTVTRSRVEIAFGRQGGFGRRWSRELTAGRWVAVGRFDAGPSRDVIVVQGCAWGVNQPDLLLLGRPNKPGQFFVRRLPAAGGCGDTAEAVDLDRDGRVEFIVGNGQWDAHGPLQVLTTGDLGRNGRLAPAEAGTAPVHPDTWYGGPDH